jgi:hypothetical protein
VRFFIFLIQILNSDRLGTDRFPYLFARFQDRFPPIRLTCFQTTTSGGWWWLWLSILAAPRLLEGHTSRLRTSSTRLGALDDSDDADDCRCSEHVPSSRLLISGGVLPVKRRSRYLFSLWAEDDINDDDELMMMMMMSPSGGT